MNLGLARRVISRGGQRWGGGNLEKRRGLGPRNDVLTTCKEVSLRGDQRIMAVFFPTVNILIEERSEPAEEMVQKIKTVISCIFVFLAYHICLLLLKLRGKLKRT